MDDASVNPLTVASVEKGGRGEARGRSRKDAGSRTRWEHADPDGVLERVRSPDDMILVKEPKAVRMFSKYPVAK